MPLDEVVARLSRRAAVDGLFAIGSTGTEGLNPTSDYDLLVVLTESPASARIGLTTLEGRLADIVVATVTEMEQVLALDAPVPVESWLGVLLRWLQQGQVLFDRGGRLQRAQQKARGGEWLLPASKRDLYQAWFHINYNLQQNRRMLASDDPVYLVALDLRLLYSLFEVWLNYFRFRGLFWEGEKKAVRFLQAHDPTFLDQFRACLDERDRTRKMQQYEALAARATAPVGGLWPDATTAFQIPDEAEVQPEQMQEVLVYWQHLMTDSD